MREGLWSMGLVFQLISGRHLCPLFALLALLANEASAGNMVTNIGLYEGGNAPVVEIKYTGNNGTWVYADAQTATNWTNPNGSSSYQPASHMNQDLATDPNSPRLSVQSVPEPASVASASIGGLSVVLLVWLRRIRLRASA
jgi:hypothetical protein